MTILELDNEDASQVTFAVASAEGWYVRYYKDSEGADMPWHAVRLYPLDFELQSGRFLTCASAIRHAEQRKSAELRERS